RCRRRGPSPRARPGTQREPRRRRGPRSVSSTSSADPFNRGRIGRASGRWIGERPLVVGGPGARGRASTRGRRGRSQLAPPVAVQDAHLDFVPPAAVTPDRLAGVPLDHEAGASVRSDRPLVEGEHAQPDPVEPEALEGMLDHQPGGLPPEALAPGVLLTDGDVEQGGSVLAVELAEGAGPEQSIGRPLVDRHGQRIGTKDPRLEEAFDLGSGHRPVLVTGEAGDLGVGIPAHEGRKVARDVPLQHDPVADQLVRKPTAVEHRGGRYTIAAMRRWSEVAERVSATTRTSIKTHLRAGYLRPLDAAQLPLAAVFFAGRPFAEVDSRTTGLGWATISEAVAALAELPADALADAYDRSSDLGLAVADVLERAAEVRRARGLPEPVVEPPSLADVAAAFAEIETAPGSQAKADRFSGLLARCDPLSARYVVKILTGELRIGLKEGLLEAALAEAFERPIGAVKRAGMLTGDVGRTAPPAR